MIKFVPSSEPVTDKTVRWRMIARALPLVVLAPILMELLLGLLLGGTDWLLRIMTAKGLWVLVGYFIATIFAACLVNKCLVKGYATGIDLAINLGLVSGALFGFAGLLFFEVSFSNVYFSGGAGFLFGWLFWLGGARGKPLEIDSWWDTPIPPPSDPELATWKGTNHYLGSLSATLEGPRKAKPSARAVSEQHIVSKNKLESDD